MKHRRINMRTGATTMAVICALLSLFACRDKVVKDALFEVLDSKATGLRFANHLNSTDSLNLFKYMYFYNGAGLGAGDFNSDGLIDVFFASNQGNNALYLNKGGLTFEDVTAKANIPADGGWSTGVSVVDINNDGLLDIYVSRVGNYLGLMGRNQFLVCTGIDSAGVPRYQDKAKEYGLDLSGFGTQAAFLDFDLDGDLDVFLLNHSVHENGTFRARSEFAGTYHQTAGSRLFRNDNGSFTDVTRESGINSSAIGYGLGIVVSDINLDGYPDIYIGNDFHENDYLYLNQKNGTFSDVSGASMMHTSQYTMGVDVADVNNDAFPEIISVDMLPSDPYILKRSLGEDTYDIFFMKISYGYNYQYTRNNLQLNRRNGQFSETGLYSGIAATDWSWSPLWMDFDNDGRKDLFISNGIPKRMNDIDYINYVSDQEIQQKIRDNKIGEKDKVLIEKFPQIKIPNKFFRNGGDMRFEDMAEKIGGDRGTYSNGAVYADFDNDGDLDVLVNNIDEPALLYKNRSNDAQTQKFLRLRLKGPSQNGSALGAKAIVFAGESIFTYEKYPVRGFLSSSEIPLHIGLDSVAADSVLLIWPDNTYERINPSAGDSLGMNIEYRAGLPQFDYSILKTKRAPSSITFEDITSSSGLQYRHEENQFREFDREPLMPHMVSTEGPALAVGDVDGNGLDDVFIGSSKTKKSALFLQQAGGNFRRAAQPSIEADSSFEDVDAFFTDINNDSHPDLIVASGGNEYYGKDRHLLPRLYLNDGVGNFTRKTDAFENIYQTASCIAIQDFNGDGYPDMFIGGRAVPWEYGKVPPSYLLQNDGSGKFKDVTAAFSKELGNAGFVTYATWLDLDKDGKKDLVLCSEWGTIDAYLFRNNNFEKRTLLNRKGWWNTLLPCDLNGDGNIDFVAGNLGLNSRLRASQQQPVRLYYNDFDENGKKEQVLTYYLNDKEIPFANKSEVERQMPALRKKYLYAEDFAKASLADIFGRSKLEQSDILTADYFESCVLINKGNLTFDAVNLPWEAQLMPIRDMTIADVNNDSIPDILLLGNYYANNIEMGRYDADYGSVLLNDGKGNLRYERLNGVTVKGEGRHIRKLSVGAREAFVIARNNDSAMLISKQARISW